MLRTPFKRPSNGHYIAHNGHYNSACVGRVMPPYCARRHRCLARKGVMKIAPFGYAGNRQELIDGLPKISAYLHR
jgi:hypothetical protein